MSKSKYGDIKSLINASMYALLGLRLFTKNNLYLTDITGNMLLGKKNDLYYPVFTDFSSEFVLNKKEDMIREYEGMTGKELTDIKNYKLYLEYSMVGQVVAEFSDINAEYFNNDKFFFATLRDAFVRRVWYLKNQFFNKLFS